MSSTAESTLGVTFARLRSEVARQMGYADPLTDIELSDINSMIDTGLRQYYYPQAIKGVEPGYTWSFLSTLKAGETVTAPASTFLLPDDYANGLMVLNITDQDADPVPIVDHESFMRQKVGGADPTSATPKTATIYRSAAAGAAESDRYTVEVYPRPTSAVTFTYFYNVVPDMISDAVPYPNGAQVHGETIIASCLAATELRKNEGKEGPFYEIFKERIINSIALDKLQSKAQGERSMHPATAPSLTSYAADFVHLFGTVGNAQGLGFNTAMYTWDQMQGIQRIVDKGLRRFYNPPTVDYKWSFMTPYTTLDTVSGTKDYDIPATIGSILGDLVYEDDSGYSNIKIVPVSMVLENRGRDATHSGMPSMVAIRPKGSDGTAEQVNEFLFWPTPDSAYTLEYQYQVRPDKMTPAKMFTLAGPEHADTIELSCLAVVENQFDGNADKQFKQSLEASISRDMDFNRPRHYGYNGNGQSTMDCHQINYNVTYNNILWD